MRIGPWAALFALTPAPAAAAPPAPEAVVAAIYRFAAGPKGDYQTCEPSGSVEACSLEGPRIRPLLTAGFAKALAAVRAREAQTNDAILDFDPISDSQDPSIAKLVIHAEPANGDSVTVDVTFWPRPEKGVKTPEHDLRYDLKRVGGAWRVDDIRAVTPGLDGDLRKIIDPNAPA